MAYPPGWSVITQTLVRRERWPGLTADRATPLVRSGEEVLPDQPVMRIEWGQPQAVPHLAPPSAQANTPQGTAKDAPEVIPSGLHGRVVAITPRGGVMLESRAAVVQGVLGAGRQVAGVLTIWHPGGPGHMRPAIPPGAILVVPGPLTFTLLRQAANSQVVGIVASSISLRDLEGFLRADLIQLINSEDSEQAQMYLPPLTLLLTEGLGNMSMPTRMLNLLSHYQRSIALLSGATSVRQGISPELIISQSPQETQGPHWQEAQAKPELTLGALVRVCSGEHEGITGNIDYLFTYEQIFQSGIRARAVRLFLEDGSALVVPLALVERIG